MQFTCRRNKAVCEAVCKAVHRPDMVLATMLPLAPDCTISCRLLPGNSLCSLAGTQALGRSHTIHMHTYRATPTC